MPPAASLIVLLTLSVLFFQVSPACADVQLPGVSTSTDGPRNRERREADSDSSLLNEERVPLPIPRTLKVLRTEPLEISLATLEDPPSQRVYFLVRESPSAGTLSAITPGPDHRGRAAVTYTPDPSSDLPLDTFTFAANYPNGRISAPVQVEITLIDPKPVLEMPPYIDFGQTLLGQASIREVPVENTGNGPFEGVLQAPPPWSWIPPGESGRLRLAPGEKALTAFLFQPLEPGPQLFRVSVPPDGTRTIRFTGEGFIPFRTALTELQLEYEPASLSRKGVIPVDGTEKGVLLEIDPGSRLRVWNGDSLWLQPGQRAEIILQLRADDTAALDETIRLHAGGYERRIPVRAGPSPARVRLLSGASGGPILDFGFVPSGDSASLPLHLANEGGQPAEVHLTLEPPFHPAPGTKIPLLLPPGSEHSVEIVYRPLYPNRDRLQTRLTGGGSDQLIILEGRSLAAEETVDTVLSPPAFGSASSGAAGSLAGTGFFDPSRPANLSGSASSSSTPGGAAGSGSYTDLFSNTKRESTRLATAAELADRQSLLAEIPARVEGRNGEVALPPLLTNDGMLALSPFKKNLDMNLPRIPKFAVYKTTSSEAQLVWERPSGDIAGFEVEIRTTRYNAPKKRYEAIWLPYDKVRFAIEETYVVATVRGLAPDSFYSFRVFTKGPDPRHSLPSEERGFRTQRFEIPLASLLSIFFLVLIAAVIGGMVLFVRRTGLV